MKFSAAVACTAMVAIGLAGCLSEDSDPDNYGELEASDAKPIWVHDGAGNLLNASAFPGDLPTFEQIFVTERISGEPTVAVTRTGAVFYPAFDWDGAGPGLRLPRTAYMRSLDGGDSWTEMSPNVGDLVRTHQTSGDPYVYADETTGRVFAVDMGVGGECNQVSWSDDDGVTWTTRPAACPIPGFTDHPTLFTGPSGWVQGNAYPNAVYLCTNNGVVIQCNLSPDGGLTWLPSRPVNGLPANCGALHGHGTASWATGTIFLPRAQCGAPTASISRDGGMTWQIVKVTDDSLYDSWDHDTEAAVDQNGTVYMFWIGNEGTSAYLSVSHDDGSTWDEPMNVTAPGVTAAQHPAIVAGSDGRIAFFYIGTETPSGWGIHDANEVDEEEFQAATWNAYVGVSLNAGSDAPVFASQTINHPDEPLKRGDCYGRCFGDIGGMYDFMDITLDPITGQVWAALVDVCSYECDAPGADADSFQRAVGAVGKQTGGTMLLSEPIAQR